MRPLYCPTRARGDWKHRARCTFDVPWRIGYLGLRQGRLSALGAIVTWADQRAVLPAVLLTFDAKTSRAQPPVGKVPPP